MIRRNALSVLLALPMAASAQTPVNAAEGASSTQDKALEAIVVTASRSDTRLQDMPLHTSVITQEDIRNSPAQTLDQLLRNVPGLLVPGTPAFASDPTGQNIKFRGMDKKVLVLVDGIPVHDPFFTTIQWFKVPLGSVDRVEVIRGGGSSLWGNLAVGGVINIVSKRPTSGDGEGQISAGSMNTWSGAVTKNFVVSDALSFTVSGAGFRTNGYNTAPADYRAAFWPGRGKSAASSENVRITAFFKPSPDLSGFVRMGYHEQNEEIGGYLFGSNQQKGPDIQAGLTKRIDDRSQIQANTWAQWIRFDKYNGAGCYAAAVFVCGASSAAASSAQQGAAIRQYASSYDAMDYRERGASFMYSREMRGVFSDMQLGVDYRLLAGEDAQESYRTPTAALPASSRIQRSNYGAGMQQFTGVFGQFKFAPLDPLEISLSTRWDTYSSSRGMATQTNYTNVATPVFASQAGGSVPDVNRSAFNPTLSARFDVNDQLALRGSTYKAFRAPGMNNMYRTFGSANITVANPALGPETLSGQEVGFDWRGSNYSFGATLFTAKVQDVVANFTINPNGVFSAANIPLAVQNICGASVGAGAALCTGAVSYNTNGQDQRSNGLEVDGKWQVSRSLSVAAYYTRTLTYYTSTSTGEPVNKQLQLVPKNVVGTNLVWRPQEKWTHTVDMRFNGAMALNLTDAVTNPVKQGGYTVFNASTAYRINRTADWFASIVNITDKVYTDSSASSVQGMSIAMPRTIMTGLRMKL